MAKNNYGASSFSANGGFNGLIYGLREEREEEGAILDCRATARSIYYIFATTPQYKLQFTVQCGVSSTPHCQMQLNT